MGKLKSALHSIQTRPLGVQLGRPHQSLHHHAILFGFFPQSTQLFRSCRRRNDIKAKLNAFKADGHVLRNAKGAPKIQISLHRDLNAFGWYAHSRSHHLTGDLRASRQSPKQEVTGTGAAAGAPDTLVCFGLIDGASDINRACDRGIRLPAFRPDSDSRRARVTAVLLFQRLLKRSKVCLLYTSRCV